MTNSGDKTSGRLRRGLAALAFAAAVLLAGCGESRPVEGDDGTDPQPGLQASPRDEAE